MPRTITQVQLPDDVVSLGYVQTRPYHWEQQFYSKAVNFRGTEDQFVQAGHSYRYVQTDPFRRHVTSK